MNQSTINALEINFEAFGQKHQAYTHVENIGTIEPTLRKLCDTIHIEEVSTQEVSEERFKEFNIENIEKWNQEVINRFEGK